MNRTTLTVHTHRSLRTGIQNLVESDRRQADLVLPTAPLESPTHLVEILLPLTNSAPGTLVLLPPGNLSNTFQLCRTIREKNINVLFLHANVLDELIDYLEGNGSADRNVFEHVRIIWSFVSDEFRAKKQLSKIKSFAPSTRIVSVFSMDESNAALASEIEDNNELKLLPIGSPLPHYDCVLVDENRDRQIITPSDTKSLGQIHLAGLNEIDIGVRMI